MGKRSAVVELFLGDVGSMQRELWPSIQREDQLTMETKLEQIAVKAVNQLPKSVVREIRTPRSVGAGAGDRLRRPGGWSAMAISTAINRYQPGCRRCSLDGRQNRQARYCERPSDPAWSETLACTDAPLAGTGRSPGRPYALLGPGWSVAGR